MKVYSFNFLISFFAEMGRTCVKDEFSCHACVQITPCRVT